MSSLTNCTDFIANVLRHNNLDSTPLPSPASFNPNSFARTPLTTSLSMDAAAVSSRVRASSTIELCERLLNCISAERLLSFYEMFLGSDYVGIILRAHVTDWIVFVHVM